MTEELLENMSEPASEPEKSAPADYAPTAGQGTALDADSSQANEDIVSSMAFWHFEEEPAAEPLPEQREDTSEESEPALELGDLLTPSASEEDLFALFAGEDIPPATDRDAGSTPEDPPEPQCVSLFDDDEPKPERHMNKVLKTVLWGVLGILLGFLLASALMLRMDMLPPFLQSFWRSLLTEQSIDYLRDLMNLLIPNRL